jgi:hypothetical protein
MIHYHQDEYDAIIKKNTYTVYRLRHICPAYFDENLISEIIQPMAHEIMTHTPKLHSGMFYFMPLKCTPPAGQHPYRGPIIDIFAIKLYDGQGVIWHICSATNYSTFNSIYELYYGRLLNPLRQFVGEFTTGRERSFEVEIILKNKPSDYIKTVITFERLHYIPYNNRSCISCNHKSIVCTTCGKEQGMYCSLCVERYALNSECAACCKN